MCTACQGVRAPGRLASSRANATIATKQATAQRSSTLDKGLSSRSIARDQAPSEIVLAQYAEPSPMPLGEMQPPMVVSVLGRYLLAGSTWLSQGTTGQGSQGQCGCAACNHADGKYRPILSTLDVCAPEGCGTTACATDACAPSVGYYSIDPQEYIFDGGDRAPKAIVLNDGSLVGLQPEDTVVQFSTVGMLTESEIRQGAIELFLELPGVDLAIAEKLALEGYRTNDDVASVSVDRLEKITGLRGDALTQLITVASERARMDAESAKGSIKACTEVACRAAIYSPRFASVRKIDALGQATVAVGPHAANQPAGPSIIDERIATPSLRQPIRPLGEDGLKVVEAFRDRNRGVPIDRVIPVLDVSDSLLPFEDLQLMRTGIEDIKERVAVQKGIAAALAWSNFDEILVAIDGRSAEILSSAKSAQEAVVYELDGKPRIRICKIASQQMAEPGEEVHFTIRLDNVGDRRVENVVVSDSLPPRLEFVEGSQSSSLETQFSTYENEVGSKVLSWKILKDLKPSEGGVIRFRCRVR